MIITPGTYPPYTENLLNSHLNIIIADRMGTTHLKDAYLLFKNHKANFQNNLHSRLINPSKSELGIISKNILKRINTSISEKYPLNLWKDSSDAINWFQNLKSKNKATFIQLDIIDFYPPSISKDLLENSLSFAKNYTEIIDEEIKIIMDSRQSILRLNDTTWIKKKTQLQCLNGSI